MKKKIISIAVVALLVVSVAFNIYTLFFSRQPMSINKSDTGTTQQEMLTDRGTSSPSSPDQSEQTKEMMIISASITLTAEENANMAQAVRDRVKTLNGKILSSNNYYLDSDNQIYTLEVKVPKASYDDFMAYLKGLAKVDSSYENAYDVANQYKDNALRIAMYETKLGRLYELMKSAKDMSDLIVIENAVSDTIYQIETLKSTQGNLEYNVDYASVSITINPLIKEKVQATGLEGIFYNAFMMSLNAFLIVIEWIIKIVFFIAPYAVIGAVGYLGYRILRKKRSKKE